jgi:spore germination protein YaaH
MINLPNIKRSAAKKFFIKEDFSSDNGKTTKPHKGWSYMTLFLASFCLMLVFILGSEGGQKLISPLVAPLQSLTNDQTKHGHEVMGFAPFWTINKLDNVDFDTLTTFAYFGVPIKSDGSLDREDYGYTVFQSKRATEVFKKAHQHGTRVVLTITQMDNDTLDAILSDPKAQEVAVNETVNEVIERGIDGVNIDFEYVGNPGKEKRDAFSSFVSLMTRKMHEKLPDSRVTVSVYASSASTPKLYDIAAISNGSDGIFMMAYDFAVAGSDQATPTAPLYGKEEGKYAYDIATSVEDFLKLMPAEKLILGVPYYGYNYMVYEPKVKGATRPRSSWRGKSSAQTYESVAKHVKADKTGWDEVGQVGWQAYYVEDTDTWRMIFLDDARSLGIKYDYAKSKGLGGVGMWALGFDEGKSELWAVLREKFGSKPIADTSIVTRRINEERL